MTYVPPRIQESKAWVDGIRGLPPDVMSQALIGRANDAVESEENDSRRMLVAKHLSFILDPTEAEAHRIEQAAARIVKGAEDLLADEADIPFRFEEFLWEEGRRERYGLDIGEDNYFAKMMRDERAAERARTQSLVRLAQIEDAVKTAEFGVNFGEAPRSGRKWTAVDTINSVMEIMALQDGLSMPIAADRVRELIVQGLGERYDLFTAEWLGKIADQADDYQAFIAAAERYGRALRNGQNVSLGLHSSMLRVATQYIGGDSQPRPCTLETALQALSHCDPIGITYIFGCARLGVALRKLA